MFSATVSWRGVEIKEILSPGISRSELICVNVSSHDFFFFLTEYLLPGQEDPGGQLGECCLRPDYCYGNTGVALFKVLVEPAPGFIHID